MYLADTLSRAHLPDVQVCEMAEEAAKVDHTETLALSGERLQQLRHASADDPVLDILRTTVQQSAKQMSLKNFIPTMTLGMS